MGKRISDKQRLDWIAINGTDHLKWELWDEKDGYCSAFRKAIDYAIRSEDKSRER